jgi:hypothetical protein
MTFYKQEDVEKFLKELRTPNGQPVIIGNKLPIYLMLNDCKTVMGTGCIFIVQDRDRSNWTV